MINIVAGQIMGISVNFPTRSKITANTGQTNLWKSCLLRFVRTNDRLMTTKNEHRSLWIRYTIGNRMEERIPRISPSVSVFKATNSRRPFGSMNMHSGYPQSPDRPLA
jgi:hypothetical protein